MSVLRQIRKSIIGKFFPQKVARDFNEQPTRPLDANALARALAGEGRRHISSGFAMSTGTDPTHPANALYLLMAQADGLNALPDFGIIGVAESGSPNDKKSDLSNIALSKIAYHLTQKAVLDFLELEGFENSTPLQNIVVEAMEIADRVIQEEHPISEYSLTAGLIFAEIMILGHRGNTRAYHIDRHHIEWITTTELNGQGSVATHETSDMRPHAASHDETEIGKLSDTIVYSRPVPRDGYILLCTHGLWKNLSDRDIQRIVLNRVDPNEACQSLIAEAKRRDPDQELSILMLYFPPDFVPWR
jgi:serine/threonine protein phosphatase PrpC